MPRQRWNHYCLDAHSIIGLGTEECPDCGIMGEYDGWHYSMIERMCAYACRTGLKPLGGHRWLADMLLGPLFDTCPDCSGRGVVADESGDWRVCRRCDGNMYLCCLAKEEYLATRRRILQEYPDAEHRLRWPPNTSISGGFSSN